MTYGGAVAALFDPFVGFLIYVSFAVLRPELMWPWSVPPGNYSRVVGVALLVGWALHGFGRWDLGRAKAVILALLGFFVWTMLSASQAPDQDSRLGIVEKYAKIVLPILVGITDDQLGASAQAPGLGHPPQSSLPRLRTEPDVSRGLQPAQGRGFRRHG